MFGYKAPKKVRYKGIEYKVHDYWLNVFETIDLLEKEDDEYVRSIILVQKIFGAKAPIEQPLLDEALKIINNGAEIEEIDKPIMDLKMDFQAYKMDVKQLFQIDVEHSDMSWHEFIEYIGYVGSKEGTALNTRARIRGTNVNEIEKKHRKEFAEYQKSIAINQPKIDDIEGYWADQIKKAKGGR